MDIFDAFAALEERDRQTRRTGLLCERCHGLGCVRRITRCGDREDHECPRCGGVGFVARRAAS